MCSVAATGVSLHSIFRHLSAQPTHSAITLYYIRIHLMVPIYAMEVQRSLTAPHRHTTTSLTRPCGAGVRRAGVSSVHLRLHVAAPRVRKPRHRVLRAGARPSARLFPSPAESWSPLWHPPLPPRPETPAESPSPAARKHSEWHCAAAVLRGLRKPPLARHARTDVTHRALSRPPTYPFRAAQLLMTFLSGPVGLSTMLSAEGKPPAQHAWPFNRCWRGWDMGATFVYQVRILRETPLSLSRGRCLAVGVL
jgi:hypothetical protein